jgi:hypothetical protein
MSLITRIGDRLVTNNEIHDPMFSDHPAVSCTFQLEKPPLERAEIQYRKLRNIIMDSFKKTSESRTSVVTVSYQLLPISTKRHWKKLYRNMRL